MLDSLRFVQGAVAKKDFVPALTHFRIEGGTIRGYNGVLSLCCPIDLDLDVMPRAVPFIKAIQTCKDTIQLHVTPAGKLAVKSGKFKAFVDCIRENYPEVHPEGETIALNGELLKALKLLVPLIADDASRPWARGVLFRGSSAFATNNVVIAEYWLGYDFPVEVNIPRAAILELLRIGEEPTSLQITENSVTFHFSGNRWLRTQTYSIQWPDVSKILDKPSNQEKIAELTWDAVEDLIPFVGEAGQLFLHADSITTELNEGAGATAEVPGLNGNGCFNIEQFRLLRPVCNTIDLTSYPAPCLFYGDRIRGAIIGVRY